MRKRVENDKHLQHPTTKIKKQPRTSTDQKKNALEIAKAGGLLYDKFEGFVQDLLDIGNKINSSQNSYKSAMEKLTKQSGNLVWQVERLKILGAKTKKSIPQRLLDKADEK